jgi:hypothetical protein
MGEYHGAYPNHIGLVVGFQRGTKARLVSMNGLGSKGHESPFGRWGSGESEVALTMGDKRMSFMG